MKKLFALILSAVMTAGILAGCGSQEPTTATVRLNEVTHSVFYAPLYVALELGFFQEKNLEVELTNGGGADKVMTAVLSGQSDIGLAGPEACIYVLQEGREDYPQVFAQLTKRDGNFLVGRTDEPFEWSDLKGKTIIGGRKGGMPEMVLEYVMRQNGVIPHKDAVVDTSVQFNMMAGAFTGGSGDYVTLFEPTATQVEAEGKGCILASLGQESGEIPYTAFFAAQSYMTENPDIIQAFTDVIARGQEWVRTHTAEEIAEVIAPQFPDTDVEVLTTVTQRHKDIDAWNITPLMSPKPFERLQDVMEAAGELENRVEFNDLVENDFALKARP